MSDPPYKIVQDVFKTPHAPISVTSCPLASLSRDNLEDLLRTVNGGIIGVAPAYGSNYVLISPSLSKVAFQMDVLATSLYHDLGLRVCSAVDLLSFSTASRQSFQAIIDSMGGIDVLEKANVAELFRGDEDLENTSTKQVALQAWAACRAATLDHMAQCVQLIPRIDTNSFLETRLAVFAKLVRDMKCLSALKPTSVNNEIVEDYSIKNNELTVVCARFKTRIMSQDLRTIKIDVLYGGNQQSDYCRSTHVDGRTVRLTLDKPLHLPSGSTVSLTTIGKEALTNAEKERVDITLRALQRTSFIADNPFFKAIWLPQEVSIWTTDIPFSRPVPIWFSRQLNASQNQAVEAIVSNDRINIIHGPPGTGKTTVIAAAVSSITRSAWDTSVWLVAQSNVAVKNIAEKLAAVDFLAFKLIVSKGEHEHLYDKINPNLIRSDCLEQDVVAAERQFLGSQVILCTLSMLSNARIFLITRIVPLQIVIVDEASQVQVGDFLPMISLFPTSLRKLVFIGDDNQLAPYGQGDIPKLQSVFEMEHLRKNAIFLDTQCIMPTRLGTFIGNNVYDSRLKSVHPNRFRCCRFLDVRRGRESKSGSSWANEGEVWAAIAEAKKCDNQGRSFRIITPYDAQRARLEDALQRARIPWEDRVFCVDSFQGNEADYIIISIVRTDKIGFLNEKRRVNVMLTRCKKGMTICTNRAFVQGPAKQTLVGLLANDVGPEAWEVV
ncbi:regulator of nonsense transcripts 1 [Favolaschia claudopus]|uniref:Regulator of nonsense transcripts 1 n=1 Tax=Favolaschia claudopus TaxID=2862362 RepID=A0AAW0C3V5_9AGAR